MCLKARIAIALAAALLAVDAGAAADSVNTGASFGRISTQALRPEEYSGAKPLLVDFFSELGSRQSAIDKMEPRSDSGVREAVVSARFRFDERMSSTLEIAAARIDREYRTYVNRAYAQYDAIPNWVSLQIGQDIVPIGFLNRDDRRYSRNPSFYSVLLAGDRFSEVGATVSVSPIGSRLLFGEASLYSGDTRRPSDMRSGQPEARPVIGSIKSESRFHEAFASYVRHDLAYFDEVKAFGAGVKLTTDSLLPYGFRADVIAEAWSIVNAQPIGPDQEINAGFVDPSVAWRWLSAGVRIDRSSSRIASLGQALTPRNGVLYHASAEYGPFARVQVERVKDAQDFTFVDETIVRILLRYSL